jgi:hypothetical protein
MPTLLGNIDQGQQGPERIQKMLVPLRIRHHTSND